MQEFFAVLSLVIGFCTFVPYFVEMAKGTARPHIFTWITWSLVTGIGFFVSLTSGGGAGAFVFGLQSALCAVVAVYALFRGEKYITRLDRFAFTGALLAIVIYVFTRQVILSVLLATLIDCLGYVPTFRKSFNAPLSEPVLTYTFSGLSFFFSIFALQEFQFTTLFFPLVLVLMNASLVTFLLVRRRALTRNR